MTNRRLNRVVPRFETGGHRGPIRARHVAGWLFAALGNVWLGLLVLSLFAGLLIIGRAVAGPGRGQFVLPVFGLALFVLAALRETRHPNRGVGLPRSLAPDLHGMVDSLRQRLDAPRVHGLLLSSELGLAVVLVPRLASLLGFRRYLVVGLPLLLCLTPDQLRALIAHELAHLCRARGETGGWPLRQRARWLHLADSLERGGRLVRMTLRPFFRWYARHFAAATFDLAAEFETVMDRRVSAVTRRGDLSAALLRVQVVEQFLAERFYPRLLADFRRRGVPPSGLQARFERGLGAMTGDPRFAAWVYAALHRDPPAGDTHPPLMRRLARLGDATAEDASPIIQLAFPPPPDSDSAAARLLGPVPVELMLSLEKSWIDDVRRTWDERHEELVRLDERRQELDARDGLTPAERLDYAIATAETEGVDAALPVLRDLVTRLPAMAPARFVLGTLLLRGNDAEGLAHLEAAITADRSLTEPGCALACEFLRANGRHADADEFLRRTGHHGPAMRPIDTNAAEPDPPVTGDRPDPTSDPVMVGPAVSSLANGATGPAEQPDAAPAGASRTGRRDERADFVPHGLDDAEVLRVKRRIAPMAAVARAFLVRANHGPHRAASLAGAAAVETGPDPGAGADGAESRFVLAVELMRGKADPGAVARRLAREIVLPGPATMLVLTGRQRKLRQAIADVAAAPLFERTKRRVA